MEAVGVGWSATFLRCLGGQGSKEGKGVGAEAASILYRKRNQDVGTSVDNRDGLSGSHVRVELAVYCLLSGIARYRGHLRARYGTVREGPAAGTNLMS